MRGAILTMNSLALFGRAYATIAVLVLVSLWPAASAWAASPVISGTPPSVATVGLTYAFKPKASDADGQTLQFRIRNKPVWAYFNTATGRLSGTPTSSHLGTYSDIVIIVTDGTTNARLPAFSITVKANRAPVISGTPSTVVAVGEKYSFKPKAYDPEGRTLTYRISNKPAWAWFNTATGRLGGAPAAQHVGTYYNIVISVSDGVKSASLPSFRITVKPAAAVTLSWTPPTQNTDGSRLTDLAGYRVFYGTTSGQYGTVLSVPNPAITSVAIEGLTGGKTWYFAIKSVDSSGVASTLSGEVSRALP
jgi:hypothetical protein